MFSLLGPDGQRPRSQRVVTSVPTGSDLGPDGQWPQSRWVATMFSHPLSRRLATGDATSLSPYGNIVVIHCTESKPELSPELHCTKPHPTIRLHQPLPELSWLPWLIPEAPPSSIKAPYPQRVPSPTPTTNASQPASRRSPQDASLGCAILSHLHPSSSL